MNTNLAKSMNSRQPKQHKAMIPRILPKRTAANLSPASKSALHMQESIVDNIMKKWESEKNAATSEVMQTVGTEVLAKKE
jgi:hypothetical protein